MAGHPDRFMGVALLPTTNPEVMLPEFEWAVNDLGMVGGFFVVGPTVKPPDHPDYELLYQKAVGPVGSRGSLQPLFRKIAPLRYGGSLLYLPNNCKMVGFGNQKSWEY